MSPAFAAMLALSPVAAQAADVLMDGQTVMVTKDSHFRADSVRFHSGGGNGFPLPSDDPRDVGGTLTVFDTGGGAGSDIYQLPAEGWKKIPPGNPSKVNGFEYTGTGVGDDPCKYVVVRPQLVKAFCKGNVILSPPFTGDVAVIVEIGGTRYCAQLGGSNIKNNANKTTRVGAESPSACPDGGGGTTSTSTPEPGTTSTSVPGSGTTSTSTSTPEGSTTSTSTPEGSSTSTSTPEGSTTSTSTPEGSTTSTSAPEGSTTSTSTPESSTTTTSIGGGGGCCNGQGFVSFSTVTAPGDCGDIVSAAGTVVSNVECAGLYTGGGGNSVPLPLAVPDLGLAISAITECTGQNATLGSTTSEETGSNRNCTNTGCFFGAPLAVPNAMTIPTSVCVLNKASAPLTGSAVCDTGATQVDLPLSSEIFLTGDKLASVAGIQPCPLCSGDPNSPTCNGGPNNGMACTAGTTAINASYPTSHDCPPDASDSIGSLPVAFSLRSGTVAWTATTATNDTGSTASAQTRVFSGFCRDVALPGGTGSFDSDGDDTNGNTFQQCWENGMAVGSPCAETGADSAESCEQKTQGAFGPNGAGIRTIVAIGSSSSILAGPSFGKLVSIFSIPPTFDATIDSAGDLPGPGAVAIPGTAALCSAANPCP